MKKIFMMVTIIFFFFTFFISPSCVSLGFSWQEINDDSQQFIGIGEEYEKDLQVSDMVNNAASILTTIGVVVVLGGLLIIGIKYMTATPEEAAKLKHKLIGLVIAGIIIIGAFGIWKLAGNLISNSIGNVEPVKVSIIETTATPPPTSTPTQKPVQTPPQTPVQTPTQGPTQTPEITITEEDQGGIDSSTINGYVYVPHINDVGTYKEKLPLIIYLHGGMNNTKSELDGEVLTKYLKSDSANVKALVALPSSYEERNIDTIVNQIKGKYNIDENRISIVGYSTGAYKASLAFLNCSTKFSAAVCISYRTNSTWTWENKVDFPMKFVYEKDLENWAKTAYNKVVSFANSKSNVDVLTFEKANGKDTRHETVQNYLLPENSNILEWMIAQSR